MISTGKWKLGFLAWLIAATAPASAQDEWPRDTEFNGPLRFCAVFFAIDVRSNEVVTVRDPGLDFTITYLEAGDRWLGIYQGNHPQTDGKEIRRTSFFKDVRVDRMTDREGAISYLVLARPHDDLPVYLHVFGNQFAGTAVDKAILERFAFGDSSKTGCIKPTYNGADAE